MKITVHRAVPTAGEAIPTVEITIGPDHTPTVTATNWEKVYRDVYITDANLLFEAISSLPGGTWDRLLCLMLDKKASLYRVRLFEPDKPIDYPSVIQSVLRKAGEGHALHLNVASTHELAHEIGKLLEPSS